VVSVCDRVEGSAVTRITGGRGDIRRLPVGVGIVPITRERSIWKAVTTRTRRTAADCRPFHPGA
jgi:hypothetical protein